MKPDFAVQVECVAGHRGEPTPTRFSLGSTWVEVVEIVDAWRAPDHRYFKLRGKDRACYILRYDAATDHWQLALYDLTGSIG